MECSGTLIRFEFFLYFELFLSEVSFHDLCIRLALSLRIFGSATLTRELHPHTIDTWSHMLDRRELDLELRLRRDSMEGKYLQYQIDPIPCDYLRLRETDILVHTIDLSRLHDIPDDEELSPELLSYRDELIELPTPDICLIVWCRLLLDTLHDSHSSIGRDERFELIHTVTEFFGRESWRGDIDDYCF
jgi:hypothetical protein